MLYWVFVLCLCQFVSCSPLKRDAGPPPTRVLDFMKQFGYLKKDQGSSGALYTEEGLSDVIKTIQNFGAINQTGTLDDATLKLMESPRCGNPDVTKAKRSKRFTFGSGGWNRRRITYYIANWSSRLGEGKVARLIGRALKTWGDYGGLKFSRTSTPDADIIVSFARGFHNDPFPFDGPGYVLAHAYFPQDNTIQDLSGDIHFDDDEQWIESSPQEMVNAGTDFYSVALHELGHSLGLAHSNDPTAVMFPYYKGDDSSLQLGHDDIMGMYQLYIAKPIKESTEVTESSSWTNTPYTRKPYTRTPYTRPTKPGIRDRTSNPTPTPTYTDYSSSNWDSDKSSSTSWYDSSTSWYTKEYPQTQRTTNTHDRFPYSTTDSTDRSKEYDEGRKNTVTINRSPYPIYPSSYSPTSSTEAPIPDICQGSPDAVAHLRGEMFVFKNQYVWRYQDRNNLMSGYPVRLQQMFPSFPDDVRKIDAAYQRPDGNMVFFSDDHYWVYDGRSFMSRKSITDYGIPSGIGGIDAVQNWAKNGKTYLYKADRFWRYDEEKKTVDPGYPEHMDKWRGLPMYLDDALTWRDENTYFIKGQQYWKFDNQRNVVSNDSPKSFTMEWLGC